MIDPAGPDLDWRVCLILSGEGKRRRLPAYSTSETAASRLARRLAGMDFALTFENADGLWYCVLWREGERSASGSGESRPLALARAVVNCRTWVSPVIAGNRPRKTPPLSGRPSRKTLLLCVDCGIEFHSLKTSGRTRRCNLCGWKRLNAARRRPRTVAAASS